MTEEVWFRIEDGRYAAGIDEWGELSGPGRTWVSVRTYRVLRHTPKGVWLSLGWGGKKFVRKDAHKRWACPTKEEAEESFRARKERQASILNARLRQIEEALNLLPMST